MLSVAIEASAHGWLDLTGFLTTWRPQYLQVGVNHRAEAESALALLRSTLARLTPSDTAQAEAFLAEMREAPWGELLVNTHTKSLHNDRQHHG